MLGRHSRSLALESASSLSDECGCRPALLFVDCSRETLSWSRSIRPRYRPSLSPSIRSTYAPAFASRGSLRGDAGDELINPSFVSVSSSLLLTLESSGLRRREARESNE